MPTPTYQDPSFDTTYQDTQYTAGASALDTEQGTTIAGIENSYKIRRGDLVRGYQDALDSINYGFREAGIGLREGYARGQTYNADGSLSGVAQSQATRVLDPLMRNARTISERYTSDLGALEEGRTSDINSARSSFGSRKADLANQIYARIREGARTKFTDTKADEETTYKRQQDAKKDPTTKEGQAAMGRQRISNPESLRKNIAKYGEDAVVRVGKSYYLRPLEERLAIQKERKALAKGGGGGPTLRETKDARIIDYNTDLAGAGQRVVTTRNPGPGEITREAVIESLVNAYPWRSRADIAKDVYAAYPDTYR